MIVGMEVQTMIKWENDELEILEKVLQRIDDELKPLKDKDILVLCSDEGQMVFRLAKKLSGEGKVIGLELDEEKLKKSMEEAEELGLEKKVRFAKPRIDRLAYPDETFDVLVSEFIVYPASKITKIGQPEMARVLKPGRKIVQTEVIVTKETDERVKEDLKEIGIEYLCESSKEDFRRWMKKAGLENIVIEDISEMVKPVWEKRYDKEKRGYEILLDESQLKIGEGIFYLFIKGEKPE